MVHLVRQVYNKAPPLGLTEGVAAMAAEEAATLAAWVAAAAVVLELRGRRRAATAVGTMRTNDARDNHRMLEGKAGAKEIKK